MTLRSILLYYAISLFTSCNGQRTSRDTNLAMSFSTFTITVGDTVKELGSNIMVVYQDKKHVYWFGSWETGVYRYDGKTMVNYTTKNGLPNNRIEEIKEDHFGNIYFNTSGGISKFDGTSFALLSVSNHSNNEWKLEPDDLWFRQGLDSGFVYRYDGHSLHKLPSPKNSNYSYSYAVYSIYKDSKGNVWFGTNPLGVFRYNGKSIDWITENDVTELHNGPANGVRSILEDKDGYFWFNTMYRYKVYDNNTNKQTFYNREKSIGSLDGKKDGDSYEYMSIAKDNNDELWFATYGDGVWRYNGKTITHYPILKGNNTVTLFSIYKDRHGDLWLGTHEEGVYKFNGKTFEQFRP